MESNAGTRPLRALLVLLGVVASIAVVAVASTGSIPTSEAGARRPTDTLVDVVFTLYLMLLVLGAAFFLYLLAVQRRVKQKSGMGPVGPLSTFVFVFILLVGLFLARRLGTFERRPPPEETLLPAPGAPAPPTAVPQETYEPEFSWLPVGAFVVLLVLAVVGVWWSGVRRRRAQEPREPDGLERELAGVLEETLDDLRAEEDAREAVIRAYARLEHVLAAHGLPRRPSDAPLEYLQRVLDGLAVDPGAARRLTLLFERAKFSQHEVRGDMKDEAIAALETMQDELRSADALAQKERESAARLALERVRAAR